MIRLVLLVAAIAIFGTGFITVIINKLTSAKNIIMDLYNSDTFLLSLFSKMAILFSHPLMLTISSLYIVGFIYFLGWFNFVSCYKFFVNPYMCIRYSFNYWYWWIKREICRINGYIIYGLWFDILLYILIIHYFMVIYLIKLSN
ncbi:hypothetical protein [Spiroplasma endosymbiont of Phyllotreta cruciferae]|uniref:hypothetical protein n=1 Tax=Spiroplasma endosymbiont of Phyllotreta cruciferae TaxID=2886375 RepID=UPI0020A12CEB|nr:hypothetical protein [Spiroplasma endosymbiont of Phyllotreta cruciferae]